jgi:bacterioferritin
VRAFRRRVGDGRPGRAACGARLYELLQPPRPACGEEDDVKGDPAIIDLLNEVLTNELTAVNQYFLHARMCENWGYERLFKKFRAESIGEMKDADELIERVLYLEGLPNVQRLGKVNVGENVPEMLRLDLEIERNAIAVLNRGIEQCRRTGDNGSAELLEDILEGEEEHANWLEAQLALLDQVGVAGYLAEQIKDKD